MNSEWLMSAELTRTKYPPSNSSKHAFYRGYADTGFHISRGGKRGRHGGYVPRRPMEGILRDVRVAGVTFKHIEGQAVRPGDRVWCTVCGEQNQLNWPDALKDPAAR